MSAPRTLFISLARGGSKGIPRKNLRTIGGIPLVGRAARLGCCCLERLGGDGRVVVSTDDDEIAAIARTFGAETPFRRPAALAGDRARSAAAVLHALDWYGDRGEVFDEVVLIQPTTPLTSIEDVLGALDLHRRTGGQPVVTVTDADHTIDFRFMLRGSRLQRVIERPFEPERHDRPSEVQIATSIYVCSGIWLRNHDHWVIPGETHGFRVDRQRSVDIDDELGLVVNEALHERKIPWNRGRVMIIAEAGVNHNGDLQRALEMIDVAADAGADVVKFQTFQAAKYMSTFTPQADYQRQNTGTSVSMLELLRDVELRRDHHHALIEKCRSRNVLFSSSVFDDDGPAFLDMLDVPFIKIPSGEITNLAFLDRVARRYRPIVLSTGMSNLAEVAVAVQLIRNAGNHDLALLQCTSDYPSKPADANLLAMRTMHDSFRVTVGYSDHTLGYEVACAAVALGAKILEKHFTLDRRLPGPDHAASAEPEELARYVSAVRNVEKALGSPQKIPTEAELATAKVARKSLVAARDLPSGHSVLVSDVAIKRPGTGIVPGDLDHLVGRVLVRSVRADQLFDWSHFA